MLVVHQLLAKKVETISAIAGSVNVGSSLTTS